MLVLLAASNAVFYFLPIFVGITAARKLGANPFLSGAIAASLLEPSFLLLGKTGDVSSFIGVPLYVFGYASSVFPALLAAVALAFLERGLKKIVTKNLQLVREIGRAGVPQMWAWPTSSWIDIQDRAIELTIAAAMAQAVIELHDRTETRRGRTSTLAIIDGQAPSK